MATVALPVDDRAPCTFVTGMRSAGSVIDRMTDPKITIRHYIRRSELVNPVTADPLDHAFLP